MLQRTGIELVQRGQNEKDFILKARMEFSKIVASNDYLSLTRYQKAQKLYNIVY